MRRRARRWFRFPFDSGRGGRFRGIGAVLRGLVLPRRRGARGGRSGSAGGGIIGSCETRNVVGAGRRAGVLAAASDAVAAHLALEVQAHLHLHHLRRALNEIGARAGLQILPRCLADRRVRRAAQLPRSAALSFGRRQRRAQQRMAGHVVEPLLRDVMMADLVDPVEARRRRRYRVLTAAQQR